MRFRIFTFLAILVAFRIAPLATAQRVVDSERAAAIVGCFATQDWVLAELRKIGLKPGTNVGAVFNLGSILKTSPSTADDLQVMFYSTDGNAGWLGLAHYDFAGRITLLDNGYRLKKSGTQWIASEGNGGVATYAAVSAHADLLAARTRTRAPLVARPGRLCRPAASSRARDDRAAAESK